jgi:hypothetical protein
MEEIEYDIRIHFNNRNSISCGMSELAWFVFRKELAMLSSVKRVEVKKHGSLKIDNYYRVELELMS